MPDLTPEQTVKNLTFSLYQRMPGAPKPESRDGDTPWGGVIGNEHWEFCEAIVRVAILTAQAYSR